MRTRDQAATAPVVALFEGKSPRTIPAGEVRATHIRALLEREVLCEFELEDGEIRDTEMLREGLLDYLGTHIRGLIDVSVEEGGLALYITTEDDTGRFVVGFDVRPESFGGG